MSTRDERGFQANIHKEDGCLNYEQNSGWLNCFDVRQRRQLLLNSRVRVSIGLFAAHVKMLAIVTR